MDDYFDDWFWEQMDKLNIRKQSGDANQFGGRELEQEVGSRVNKKHPY